MSGAAGHISHLTENRKLKLGEIKDIIRRAGDGKLDHVTEKLDGCNLMFTWNVKGNQLRVARNTSDIKKGGIDLPTLAKRFYERKNVEEAFTSAFKVLRDVLTAFNDRQKIMMFGYQGQIWYSIEVIVANDPNIIHYDSNNIVFHEYPTFEVVDDMLELIDGGHGIEMFTKNVDKMQASVKLNDWNVRGPTYVKLKNDAQRAANDAIVELDMRMRVVGANDDETLEYYVQRYMHSHVHAAWLTNAKDVERMIIERASGVIGSATTIEIKKRVLKSRQEAFMNFMKTAPDIQKEALQPIESLIQTFATKLLNNVQSTLVDDHVKEIERLKNEVTKAIKTIEDSKNSDALNILQKEMKRLGTIDNISSTVEGIVFPYGDKVYKLTGSFAPVHQILALFKYGRKGIPKLSLE